MPLLTPEDRARSEKVGLAKGKLYAIRAALAWFAELQATPEEVLELAAPGHELDDRTVAELIGDPFLEADEPSAELATMSGEDGGHAEVPAGSPGEGMHNGEDGGHAEVPAGSPGEGMHNGDALPAGDPGAAA